MYISIAKQEQLLRKSSTQHELHGGSNGGNDATSHLKARRNVSQSLHKRIT